MYLACTLSLPIIIRCFNELVYLMKKYGIRVTLPDGDFLSAPEFLGKDFESYRWFETEEERDRALREMKRHMPNYRRTDFATQILEKTER